MLDAQSFLKSVPHKPGIYQMLDEKGKILYVGKAKDLKKRLASYFRQQLPPKTVALMSHTEDINIIVTGSELEALLLESERIKKELPRYNVLLRDDKSYPYIYISSKTNYPRLDFYRGNRQLPGRYFGPYPNVSSVRDTIYLLQSVFKIRQCSDTFFKNRSRPCLQYQIKRCSAPCVGYIDEKDYQQDIQHATEFLEGKSDRIIAELTENMKISASKQAYEEAAKYRDQISSLRKIQEEQYIASTTLTKDIDIIACVKESGVVCLQLLMIRQGRVLGDKAFFPQVPAHTEDEEIFAAFLAQHYLAQDTSLPHAILSNIADKVDEALWQALTQKAGRKIKLYQRIDGERKAWMQMALSSATYALRKKLLNKTTLDKQFAALRALLSDKLTKPLERIECFDVSHHSGEATVASCVVFSAEGPLKSDYRRFNIHGVKPGDDYHAMQQALTRRYKTAKKLPDVLLVDGGKGQLTQAQAVIGELGLKEILLVGIAKGVTRKPGMETLFVGTKKPLQLDSMSPALHLLQQVRDEAHRFAITHHRGKKQKRQGKSSLENIPGIGAKRRKALLEHFGGLQALKQASEKEIAKVPGISAALAHFIYDALK